MSAAVEAALVELAQRLRDQIQAERAALVEVVSDLDRRVGELESQLKEALARGASA